MKQQVSYSPGGLLHTEMLEQKYKTITVQVLYDDDRVREALLVNEDMVTTTYAITFKNDDWRQSEEMCSINNDIKGGTGIGRAFKAKGFAIQKNVLDVFITPIPLWLQDSFKSGRNTAKVRVIEFFVRRKDEVYHYATIAEVYAPAFRKPVIHAVDELQINIPSTSLQQLGFSKRDIWQLLESKTIVPGLAKNYTAVTEEIRNSVQAIMLEPIPLPAFC
ncbi:MAG: hypothetical protein KF746_22540 [Chitinophagaceae bacterium]|nr:hypothetical protein [Chitinophagaceae bacterium]